MSTSSRRFYRSLDGNKREITFHPRSPLRGISLNFLEPPAAEDSQIETCGSVSDSFLRNNKSSCLAIIWKIAWKVIALTKI